MQNNGVINLIEWKHLWKSRWGILFVLLLLLNAGLFVKSTIRQNYEKAEYLQEYEQYVASISEKAEEMGAVSIFSDSASYSAKNIKKTSEAFADCKNLALTESNDTAFEQLLSWKLHHVFLFLLLFMAVDVLLTERKNGLWEVTYAETVHRKKLCWKKVTALFLTSFLMVTLFLVSEFLCGIWKYGGLSDMAKVVQTSRLFLHFPFVISKWKFLVLYDIFWTLGVFFGGCGNPFFQFPFS